MMRITVNISDDLVANAQAYTGIENKSELIRRALQEMVAHEAGLRLARLGGSAPDLVAPPRRRFD